MSHNLDLDLPEEVRTKLAELNLELSEGKCPNPPSSEETDSRGLYCSSGVYRF